MVELDPLLQTLGVRGETLKRVVSEKHRYEIAKRIGGDWESLATFIGVPNGDIDDIKEEHRKPLDRRLAMMRRWHELTGKEATYLRLIEGLRQIGKKDLIEHVVELKYEDSAKGLMISCPSRVAKRLLNCSKCLCSNCCRFCCVYSTMVVMVLIIMMYSQTSDIDTMFYKQLQVISTFGNIITGNEQNQAKTAIKPAVNHSQRKIFDDELKNYSFPERDLPRIHPLFVGRENDVHQVLLRVARAHIVNINGAPGFGKSTLAIHVGYEIVKNGSSVRYINLEDDFHFSVLNQMENYKSERKATFEISSYASIHQLSSITNDDQAQKKSFVRSKDEELFEELQRWSETVIFTSVLILDNCDDVLASAIRHEFLNLIEMLITKSHFKLHIIIISHEKLFYVDSFDCWMVRELNQSASVELLDKIAPAIDNESLREVAELVEGCPLALKIIGKLLDIHGDQLIHKLKKELLSMLDKVSLPDQRFRVILDVAFNRLGLLRDCGHMLSLFPGSFDEKAGNAIVHEECLETYLKHSLLNDYYIASNYRYKMHRLIKEYLKEKISVSQNVTFITKFRKHFETLLLNYFLKQEIDDVDKYTLKLEAHNLYYFRNLLLDEIYLSPEELTVLIILFNIKFVQFEQFRNYYPLYIENVRKICPTPLSNIQLCGHVYTNIVRHLYRKNFSSCTTKHFQCEVISYLQDLHRYGALTLSVNESDYIDSSVTSNCRTNDTQVYIQFVTLLSVFFFPKVISVVYLVVIVGLMISELALRIYVISVYDHENASFLLILEIFLKWVCQHVIVFIVSMFTHRVLMIRRSIQRELNNHCHSHSLCS